MLLILAKPQADEENGKGNIINKKLEHAVVSFASSYAKKYLERHYDGFTNSPIGRQTVGLDANSKRMLEFTLMGIGALVATQRDKFSNSPIKTVIWEIIYDAPSEIIARLSRFEGSTNTSCKPESFNELDEQVTLISSSLEDLGPDQLEELLGSFPEISKDDLKEIISTVSQRLSKPSHQTRKSPVSFDDNATNNKPKAVNSPDKEQDLTPTSKNKSAAHRKSAQKLEDKNRRLDEKIKELDEKIQQARDKRKRR